MITLMNRRHIALASAALLAAGAAFAAPTAARAADTTLNVTGTPGADYASTAFVNVHDTSALTEISVYYTWDNYIHRMALPVGNTVSIFESFTCHNDGSCHDFMSPTGKNDQPGLENQPHETIHRNSDITFHTTGSGATAVDEHYEHGALPRIDLKFADGREYYVNFIAPGYTQAFEPKLPDGTPLPHLEELYIQRAAGQGEAAWYAPDVG